MTESDMIFVGLAICLC